jgi:hypothetical protein
MKKFKAFFTAFSVIFVAVSIISVSLVSEAEARITISVKNATKDKVYIAFCWGDFPDEKRPGRRQGWSGVAAGETKKITFEDAMIGFTYERFGYYAQGGGKVWAGTSSNGISVIIHPNNSFKGHTQDPISGGKKVYFHRVSLKQIGDTEHATGSITLK